VAGKAVVVEVPVKADSGVAAEMAGVQARQLALALTHRQAPLVMMEGMVVVDNRASPAVMDKTVRTVQQVLLLPAVTGGVMKKPV
jgi:hypothetical protein